MSKSWARLFLCLSSIACAQSIDIPVLHCVVHAGDSPARARPDLNQSGWKPYSEWEFSFDQLLRSGADGAALARAAQQFGQEDDITVLTLQYAPAEVLHA